MNMKLTVTLAALVATTAISAFGQGYVIFDTTKNNVYDDFTASGTSTPSAGTVTATFIWAQTGTTDPLGAGLATGATTAGSWAAISSALTNGWSVAVNNGTGLEADVNTGTAVTTKGALAYNGGSNFALQNSVAGDSYEFVVIGWAASAGSTLEAAENNGAVGWSGAFTYVTGSGSLSTPQTFPNSGEAAFGVAPVPEPASLALAGLGGLSMLFLRRRKA